MQLQTVETPFRTLQFYMSTKPMFLLNRLDENGIDYSVTSYESRVWEVRIKNPTGKGASGKRQFITSIW